MAVDDHTNRSTVGMLECMWDTGAAGGSVLKKQVLIELLLVQSVHLMPTELKILCFNIGNICCV